MVKSDQIKFDLAVIAALGDLLNKMQCEGVHRTEFIWLFFTIKTLSQSVLEVFRVLFWRAPEPVLDFYTSFKLWITETVTSCTQVSGRQPSPLCSVGAADLRLFLSSNSRGPAHVGLALRPHVRQTEGPDGLRRGRTLSFFIYFSFFFYFYNFSVLTDSQS